MFVKAIEKACKAMFPIIRIEPVSLNQVNIAVVGTGFFIGPNGTFASVAHVFDGRNSKSKYQFVGHLPNKVQNPALEIQEVKRDDANDLFIGKLDIATPDYLEISPSLVPVGKSVCIAGYPLATFKQNAGGIDVNGVRRYFQPTFVLDHLIARIAGPAGTQARTHDGFLARDVGLFGMSGGPIFDNEGTVFGLQASVTDPRESTNGVRKIIVEHAQAVRSPLLLSLINK